MAKVQERMEAERLRRKGWSVGQISKHLRVSRASASNWCRDIRLTPAQRAKLDKRWREGSLRGRIKGAEANHAKKVSRVRFHADAGKKSFASMTATEFLAAGIGIYWGEGSKKSRLSFINSDKDMVVFMYRWFCFLGVAPPDFIVRVSINETHRSRDAVIRRYWSRLLGVPLAQFRPTSFIHRENAKRYANHDEYFGLLTIRVRNSTELKYRILGLIEGLKYSRFEALSG